MNDELRWAASNRYHLLKDWARQNRKNPTEAEKVLWEHLREKNLKTKFFRQYIIADYIVDFVSLQSSLIIEVDGAYHCEHEQQRYDADRTERLESFGFKLIRFSNDEVILHTDKIIETIEEILNERQ